MQILLCAATEFEIQPTIDFIAEKAPGNITVLITGLGLTAAAYEITKAIITKKPGLVLQAGIAGSLDENLPLAKVVLVKNESIGDLGVTESGRFKSLFDMNFLNENSPPWKEKKLPNRNEMFGSIELEEVDAVTINEITTEGERMSYYKNELGAKIESMEGAALHYVCLQENVPFLQIRSLSNFAGERDKSKWRIKDAIASLNSELQRIILKLLDQ